MFLSVMKRPDVDGAEPENPKRFVSMAKRVVLTKVPGNLAARPASSRPPKPSQAPPKSGAGPTTGLGARPATALSAAAEARKRQAAALFAGLSPEQRRYAKAGGNLFITGAAGSGKSMLLSYLVAETRDSMGPGAVGITGSTGVAAVQVGGTTIHQWAGVGRGDGTNEEIAGRLRGNKTAVANWLKCRVLFIDEISMVSAQLFQLISFVGCSIRANHNAPFGGVRVVVCGDFHQLPPVDKTGTGGYCFETPEWQALFPAANCAVLTTVLRQREGEFVRLLSLVRQGDVSALAELNKRCCRPLPSHAVLPSRLFCRNAEVDSLNAAELEKLAGKAVLFKSIDTLIVDRKIVLGKKSESTHPLFKQMTTGAEVALKVGAQCLLLANLAPERGLVNGSRGVVTAFVKRDLSASPTPADLMPWFVANGNMVPVVRFANGTLLEVDPRESSCEQGDSSAMRINVPLALCWATTIHKSQGLTLDRCETDLSDCFEFGQCYTALSRVRSLDGLHLLKPLAPHNVRTSPAVLAFYASLAVKK